MISPLVIALTIFCAVGIVFYGVWSLRAEGSRKDVMKGRLKGEPAGLTPQEAIQQSIVREVKYSDIPFLNTILGGAAFAGIVRLYLLQARVKTSPGTILLLTLLLMSIGFFGGWFATEGLFASIGGCLIAGSVPVWVVAHKRRKRFDAFARQLPDALTMMKNSLQAGHTLDKAMQVISEEMPDPVALEFRETVEELHLGVPIKRAMENFSNRIIDENLKIFVAALLVQREVGGNLTELLGNLAGTIRERFRMDQEVQALTAEGRISGYVIGALPVALMIIISSMQPDYLKPLFETEMGNNLLKLAVGLEFIGFFFIRRACRVNY